MNKEFIEAVEALEREKHMSKDVLIEAIESALVSAYKKNYGTSQNVRVNIDRKTGDIDVFMRRDIVEAELTSLSSRQQHIGEYTSQASISILKRVNADKPEVSNG